MEKLHSIDFARIRSYSKDLKKEVRSWYKHPISYSEMVAQYQRIHTTVKMNLSER